jgi:hypothetical protein
VTSGCEAGLSLDGETTLERAHPAMVLLTAEQAEALKRFLIEKRGRPGRAILKARGNRSAP